MALSDRDLKKYFAGRLDASGWEARIWEGARLRKTISSAKEAWLETEEKGFLSRAEFIYCQGRYIKKRWWFVQGLLLGALWLVLNYVDSSRYIERCMGVAAPLFVLLIVPELWKNRSADAMEIEGAAFYSLREIYAARMLLFAMVDLALLSLFFIAASHTARLPLWELILQFFVPFNAACCICFRLLYSRRGNAQLLALLLCMVWTAVWIQIVLKEAVYEAVSVPVWIVLLLLSGAYWGYSIWRGQKACTEIWEVKTLWT